MDELIEEVYELVKSNRRMSTADVTRVMGDDDAVYDALMALYYAGRLSRIETVGSIRVKTEYEITN